MKTLSNNAYTAVWLRLYPSVLHLGCSSSESGLSNTPVEVPEVKVYLVVGMWLFATAGRFESYVKVQLGPHVFLCSISSLSCVSVLAGLQFSSLRAL